MATSHSTNARVCLTNVAEYRQLLQELLVSYGRLVYDNYTDLTVRTRRYLLDEDAKQGCEMRF